MQELQRSVGSTAGLTARPAGQDLTVKGHSAAVTKQEEWSRSGDGNHV